MERIVNTELGVIREPLRAPFGFKGGTLSELWQTAVRLTLDSGASGMGVGVQSVLWSDPVTFCACDEAGGNERMLAVTRRALELLQGQAFTDPPGMTAGLVPELLAFARRLLGRADVPQTFVLNALVPVDFALWQLWNAKRGNGTFDALCASFCPELTNREKELGSIPLITYHTPEDELHALLEDGAFLLKVKIGSDPEKNGDPEAMLAWDIGRLRTVHTAAAGFTTPYTECGRPVYYLDANGRYPDREFLLRFLDAADKMDALERIVLLEEPFAGDRPEPVHGLPVRVAGDESAHSAQDVARLTREYGYSAIACKPIGKNAVRHAGDGARGAEKRRGVLLRGPDGAACAFGLEYVSGGAAAACTGPARGCCGEQRPAELYRLAPSGRYVRRARSRLAHTAERRVPA